MSKSILIISYYFPPIKAIGGIRTYNFTKYLNLNGWNTTVFTTSAFKILGKDNFFKKLLESKYIYLPTYDIQVIRKILNFQKKSPKSIITSNINNKISTTTFMQKIRNSFPFNILYEGGFIYIFFGIIYGLYYTKKYDIKYVYSTFSPNSNHIIAYFIKLINKKIYWVADFRDLPIGDSEAKLFMKQFQLWLNTKIYKKSDSIITISEGLKNIISKYNQNIYVVNNGIDINVDELSQTKNITDFFDIAYTGSLYAGKRDAELLFKVIKKLIQDNNYKKIRLVYAGKDGNIWNTWAKKYKLEKYILIYNQLSMVEVKKVQLNASINLMLTWATKEEKGILTGKFYEYLPYFKPIICLINGEKDIEIEEKFYKLNCGLVEYKNENRLFEFIKQYLDKWQKNQYIHLEYNQEELKKYTSSYLTQQLESILLESKNI